VAAVGVVQAGGPGIHWEIMRMPDLERHLTMVYVESLGTGESGRLATHPHGYTRDLYAIALDRLLDHLDERVFLIGHSYGGFVAQHYAATRPGRLAGLVLYDSSPVTGDEFGAELMRNIGEFAQRHQHNPELPAVLAALRPIGAITGDEELNRALRGLLPSYLADYWGRRDELEPLVAGARVTYIAGGEVVDDRALLPTIDVPTLVIAGRYDIVCGPRWALELHDLILGSKLAILERSGHLGHTRRSPPGSPTRSSSWWPRMSPPAAPGRRGQRTSDQNGNDAGWLRTVSQRVSVKASMLACAPPKREPVPEAPVPPNGAFASSFTVWSLMCTMPVGIWSASSTPASRRG
jgi:pimeloyl-ACP methyl ester carboxylesterase